MRKSTKEMIIFVIGFILLNLVGCYVGSCFDFVAYFTK
jgi:hypothetical protein